MTSLFTPPLVFESKPSFPNSDRIEQAKQLLQSVFEPVLGQGYGSLCLTHALRGTNGKLSDRSYRHEWFDMSRGGIVDTATRAIELADQGREVYFACQVHEASNRGTRNKTTALALTVLWADIDFSKPTATKRYPSADQVHGFLNKIELTPSAVVATGSGVHAYWFLSEALTVPAYAELPDRFQAYLRARCPGDMDQTGNLAATMRVPGTRNQKHSPAVDVSLVAIHPERRYALDDLARWIDVSSIVLDPQATALKTTKSVVVEPPVEQAKEDALILERAVADERFVLLYHGADETLLNCGSYKSRSEADLALCGILARYTSDPIQIDRLFRLSNRVRSKWTSGPKYRQRTIEKALEGEAKRGKSRNGPVKGAALSLFEEKYAWPSVLKMQSSSLYRAIVAIEKERRYRAGSRLFVGYKELAGKAKISKNTVRVALEELADFSLISLKIGAPNQHEKHATEICRTIPIPTRNRIDKPIVEPQPPSLMRDSPLPPFCIEHHPSNGTHSYTGEGEKGNNEEHIEMERLKTIDELGFEDERASEQHAVIMREVAGWSEDWLDFFDERVAIMIEGDETKTSSAQYHAYDRTKQFFASPDVCLERGASWTA